jgi:hypothetical protein
MGSIRPASPLLLLAAIAASATPPVARFVPTRRNATDADTPNPRVFLAMTAAAEDEEAKLLPYVLAHYAALGIPRRNFIVTLHARPGGEGAYAAMAATLEAAGCRGHVRWTSPYSGAAKDWAEIEPSTRLQCVFYSTVSTRGFLLCFAERNDPSKHRPNRLRRDRAREV